MARPGEQALLPDQDKSNNFADQRAFVSIKVSLEKTTDFVEKAVVMDVGESGASMKSSHTSTCKKKAYFLKNRLEK